MSGFTVEDFGKLYRACGNCDSMYERHVVISDVTASNGDLIAGELAVVCSPPEKYLLTRHYL